MRRMAVALSLMLTLPLWSPTDAQAGPPWAPRSEVRLAGGPPPWAPAHGYRHKHRPIQRHHHHHHHHHDDDDDDDADGVVLADPLPDLGLGPCNRALVGALMGGVTGSVLGAQLGRRSERTATALGGAIIGAVVGGAIGRSMDQADQACVGQALERASTGQSVAWTNPDGGHYQVTPDRTWQASDGRSCREYTTEARIGGRRQQVYGTACRQPDGSWERVS